MNIPKSLSDIAEYLGKKDVKTLKEEIDSNLGGLFIPSATIVSLLFSPDITAAVTTLKTGIALGSFKFSKLLNWLPDKLNYVDKGREETAIKRYEKAAIVNIMVLHLATYESIYSVFLNGIEPIIKKSNRKLEQQEIDKIIHEFSCREKDLSELNYDFFNYELDSSIKNYTSKFYQPLFKVFGDYFVNNEKDNKRFLNIISKVENHIYLYYNAYLVSLVNQFPEFGVWIDVTTKTDISKLNAKITKKLNASSKEQKEIIQSQKEFNKNFNRLIKEVEELNENVFKANFGLKEWIETHDKVIDRQTQKIEELLKKPTLEAIKAHHNFIVETLDEKLVSENTDIPEIVYPANKNIFIPQSFRTIKYDSNKYAKRFLEPNFWTEETKSRENIENFLTSQLIDPRNSNKPIVILGHPGAGKSMLSKIITARLTKSKEFFPFLVKLRDISSKTVNINEHLNEGLRKTGLTEVKWLEWAKEFKERIPVIILDGFDELLRASSTELNDYLNAIKRFQQIAIHHDICPRVILTSRLTIMQDVTIPDHTTIIKLDSFDKKRQDIWIDKWNTSQTKSDFKSFKIPNNSSIQDLAKEPLLLFMLAVYDFEGNELQNAASDKEFNQSKLYDKLFERFTERQVKKDEKYPNLSPQDKIKQKEIFRLRLGVMSLMMFQTDTTYIEANNLKQQLEAFKLSEPGLKPNQILGGFFFVHQNKSTEDTSEDIYVFEFLHKTFGEFLAADFLLRVVLAQNYRPYKRQYAFLAKRHTFNFCFGYNWLHKHYKITSFLFEFSEYFFRKRCNQGYDFFLEITEEDLIKEQLKTIFGTSNLPFPVDIQLINKKAIIEHLAIYSQNLIILWVALKKSIGNFEFNVEDDEYIPLLTKPTYEAQDSAELRSNKKLWKRITQLWELSNNSFAIAKLKEWIKITEKQDAIFLEFSKDEIAHNYGDAATIACNDFERLLSLNDSDISLDILDELIKKKPEFLELTIKTLNNRFDLLVQKNDVELMRWLKGNANLFAKISTDENLRLIENSINYFPTYFEQTLLPVFQLNQNKTRFLENLTKIIQITAKLNYSWFKMLGSVNIESLEYALENTIKDNANLYSKYYLLKKINEIPHLIKHFDDSFKRVIQNVFELSLMHDDLKLKLDILDLMVENIKSLEKQFSLDTKLFNELVFNIDKHFTFDSVSPLNL